MWSDLKRENLLFVLVDFQDKFFPILKESVVKLSRANINLIIKTFKMMNIPMIGTEHYVKGLGHTDKEVLSIWKDSPMSEKITFSCCGNKEFIKNLESNSKPVIVVAGLETQICVLQTVLDLLKKNYQVLVVKDAVLSSTKLKWENGLEMMKDAGAHIINTETLLFYLLNRADTPEFKKFVPLLKENMNNSK